MQIAARILVGLTGLVALAMAIAFWIDPAAPAARLGVDGTGGLGAATLRADFGAFFAGAGILSVFAAVRNSGRLLTAPLLLIAFALAGRVATSLLAGHEATMTQPMVVEAVLLGVLAFGRWKLAAPASS